MGEIAINPTHNVHQKYRQMNLVNPYIFAPPVDLSTNTYIGGVASTIGTASTLATKLAIDVSRITNFSIIGSDIKCKIEGTYSLPSNCFINDTLIIYYYDYDNLLTSIGERVFQFATNFKYLKADGVTTISGGRSFERTSLEFLYFPNLTSTVAAAFNNIGTINGQKTDIYMPNCLTFGTNTNTNESIFYFTISGSILYLNTSLATSNAGGEEADVVSARAYGAVIRYVSNFIKPNPVTTLVAGTIYNTAIQLNFTPPTGSTNAIESYECYANGVFKNRITASGQYITGLTSSASCVITVVAIDIFGNKSLVSNSINISTTNRVAVDADAIAYISASSNVTYQDIINDLFISLKSNSLYAKIQAFYPFLGTTAVQHKWNAKNPLDTNTAFRLTFVGTSIFSNNGYQLSGSSYANTYFIPSVQQSLNSNGFSFVVGTNNTPIGDCVDMGSFISGTQKSYLVARGGANKSLAGFNSVNVESVVTSQARGIFTGTKQSSTVTDLFINGTQVSTSAGAGTLPTVNVYIGAMNLNGSVYGNSNQRIQFVAFHEGLSDVEVVVLHSIINTFEMLLGRKTW